MVDLCGAILCRQGHIFDQAILMLREKQLRGRIDQKFTGHPFEPGRSQDACQDDQWYEIPQRAKNLLNDGAEVHFLFFLRY